MGLLKSILFQPLLMGPLLAMLVYGPAQVQAPLLGLLGKQSLLSPQTTTKTLSILVALGVLGNLNSLLSSWANRNFRLDQGKKWDWRRGKELAVVTGGSAGIGLAIVEKLSAKGVRVVVLDIVALPKEFEENDLVEYLKCDISDAAEIKAVTDRVKSQFGDPSILINNAGVAAGTRPILSTTPDTLRKIFSVNLLSQWALAQAFLPAMVARDKGHVMAMASLSSFVTIPNGVAYSASKAGLLAFQEGLAVELALVHRTPGVLTSVVHPHWVRTQLIKHLEERIKAKRGGMLTPEEVAGRVVRQVFEAKGGQVIIPDKVGIVTALRGWPSWIAVLTRNFLGKLTADQIVDD